VLIIGWPQDGRVVGYASLVSGLEPEMAQGSVGQKNRPMCIVTVWCPTDAAAFFFRSKLSYFGARMLRVRQLRRPIRQPLHLDLLHATREPLATAEHPLWLSRKTGRDWPYKGVMRQGDRRAVTVGPLLNAA